MPKSSCLRLSLVLVVLGAPLSPSVRAQLVSGSGEVGGVFGYSNLKGADMNNHPNFGGTGGFNATKHIQVFGEYLYSPEGSVGGATAKAQWLGGGVRFHFGSWLRASPFVVLAGGYNRVSASDVGISAGVGGPYVGSGGGVSVYLKRFVVRPEFRYEYIHYGNLLGIPNTGAGGGIAMFNTALLYQFGGH